jgi:competence protein ComEC
MTRGYGLRSGDEEHPFTDADVVAVVLALVVGVWGGTWAVLCVIALSAGGRVLGWATWRVPVAALVLAVVGSAAGHVAWLQAHPRHLGPYIGWARIMADPAPYGSGLRVTVEIEGERFDTWLYGSRNTRIAPHQAGEYVWLQGARAQVGHGARRAAVRHVVGRFHAEVVGDLLPGAALWRASNQVRSRLRSAAAASMPVDEAALFTGLVLGDDGAEPPGLVADFRRSGLSHLTAVSGQNVAFILAAALPLLRRLRAWWRWAATLALIGWFMAITRFEPSVLRAGVMAMLAATAFVLGRQASSIRLLALAVGLLVLADPLLVWSVGFWLSVGATAGVCLAGPWWLARLPGPMWLRAPMAITLGAQVGVALPSLLVFHRLPLVSPLANLAAVPVAGAVMLYGVPAGVVAPSLPGPLGQVVMAPNVIGTRWVATVARVAAAIEPPTGWSLAGWALVVGGWCTWWRRRGRHSARVPADVPI